MVSPVGEGDPHGGAHEVALGHGGHAVGAGGDVVQTVGAGGVGHGVLVGEAGAVKELDGGVRNGVGAVGDGAVYRGQNAGGGGKDQIDVLLLETLDLEAAAVRQTIEVLQGVSHWMITS